jgi:hypothetical protein
MMTGMKLFPKKLLFPVWISCCFSILLFLPSCTHDPIGIEELDTVCFDTRVFPIIQTSCGISGCHNGVSGEEGFDASNYESIMKAVTPGDPRGSTLYKVITDIHGEHMMPPDLPLNKEQRTLIQVWIAQGAIETHCTGSDP